MAISDTHTDMAQFFDFGEASMSEPSPSPIGPIGDDLTSRQPTGCSVEGCGATDGCPHNSQTQETQQTVETEWNPDFSSWLPRYQKLAQPCQYCQSRSLECYIFNGNGQSTSCAPCNALFRPCSFSDPDKLPMLKSKTALDTLDVVTEDTACAFGGRTGRQQMRSLGHVGPLLNMNDESGLGVSKRTSAIRFPRAAIKILKDWLTAHIDHPYPTEEEKEALKLETGLTLGQISNWMANTRRRQKARPKRAASPSVRPVTQPMNIPAGQTWDEMDPLERWKHSPPENEPAPLTAIAHAVETFDPPEPSSLSSSYNGRKKNSDGSTGSFSVFRAPSTTSLETGFTNMSSGSAHSYGSAWSHGSRHSLGSLNSLNSRQERRRRRRLPVRAPKRDVDNAQRLFQCTFCTDRFKSKYDWSRHEKSLHLSLEKWICAPLGDVITCSSSGQRKCVYCDALDPTKEHLAAHNHSSCEEKGLEARTFYRKDHLRQHLRLMHGCKMTPSMDTWKAEVQYIKSRCGFCGMTFDKWQDRVDHLSKEFRNGATMKDWKGCRGLDAHVAAHVTNAMPPYLIANESLSPFPFSATNAASMKHQLHLVFRQGDDLESIIPSRCPTDSSSVSPTNAPTASSSTTFPRSYATCWEILTLRLGQFARAHIEQHGTATLTDDLLQSQARYILYDSDDPWNQTAADNPEWLALFKQAHGITNNSNPLSVRSQHNILEDLGIGPYAPLDPSFDLRNFDCVVKNDYGHLSDLGAYECSLAGSRNLSRAAKDYLGMEYSVSKPGHDELPGIEGQPISELMCTPGGVCVGENGEIGVSREKVCRFRAKKQAYFVSGDAAAELAPVKEKACTRAGEPVFALPPVKEKACTRTGEPVFALPAVKERACTAAGDAINPLPPVTEKACTASGDALPPTTQNQSFEFQSQDAFAMQDWSQLPTTAFDMSSTTAAGLSSSLPANMGFSGGMRWDDQELGFSFDMDMEMGMDMMMGDSNF